MLNTPEWWPFEAIGYEMIFCLHCENTFNPAEARPAADNSAACPHCGAGPLDWRDWNEVRDRHVN